MEGLSDVEAQNETNVHDWQTYTRDKNIPLADIHKVVYKYTYEQIQQIDEGNLTEEMRSNRFIDYLVKKKDKEAIRFLLLAKNCERQRFKQNDPWWYPTKEELSNQKLQKIIDEALAYKGNRLKSRYLLQAIRATVTMGNSDLCRKIWHEQFKQQPRSVLREMAEEYVAGMEYDAGNWRASMNHYDNIACYREEYWNCVRRLAVDNTELETARLLLQHNPNQSRILYMAGYYLVEDDDCSLNERSKWIKLAFQAIADPRVENTASWWLMLAYSAHRQGDSRKALNYTQLAITSKGTKYTYDHARIFQIYLQSLTGKYDKDFDAAIAKQLKWLDGCIQANITPDVVERYTDWDMHKNLGYYYYNDALRRIAFSVMIPNYLKKGKEVEALLLSGMVSERYRTMVNFRKDLESTFGTWNPDFYTDVFEMMDTLSIAGVNGYLRVLEKGGKNAFERFCAAGCYKNLDYIREILATKCIREEAFDKAISLLKDHDTAYDSTLNVYDYFRIDPFAEPLYACKAVESPMNYKLNFATHMKDLQQMMCTVQSPRLKAEATFRYALGLLRSTDDCWALTKYVRGSNEPKDYQKWSHSLHQKAQQLATEAFTYTTDREFNYKWIYVYLNAGRDGHSPERDVADYLRKEYHTTDFYQYYLYVCDTQRDWKKKD